MSVDINWNPIGHLGPVPINWYGLTMAIGFLVCGYLVWRWAPKYQVLREKLEGLLVWIVLGSVVGARIYYVVQNDFYSYLQEPWRILAVWEGGLAFFGGLFGGTLAAYLYHADPSSLFHALLTCLRRRFQLAQQSVASVVVLPGWIMALRLSFPGVSFTQTRTAMLPPMEYPAILISITNLSAIL